MEIYAYQVDDEPPTDQQKLDEIDIKVVLQPWIRNWSFLTLTYCAAECSQ